MNASVSEVSAEFRALHTVFNTDVVDERWRQLERFGVQRLRDGTGDQVAQMDAFRARVRCQEAFGRKVGTWLHILDEEVKEAFAETEYAPLRAELIQVATVALAWVADLDARQPAPVPAVQPELDLSDLVDLVELSA